MQVEDLMWVEPDVKFSGEESLRNLERIEKSTLSVEDPSEQKSPDVKRRQVLLMVEHVEAAWSTWPTCYDVRECSDALPVSCKEASAIAGAHHRHKESNQAEEPHLPEENLTQEAILFTHIAVVEGRGRASHDVDADSR